MREINPRVATLEPSPDLVGKLRQFARRVRAASSLRSDRSRMRVFAAWCEQHQRTACPASGETVGLFLTDVAERYRFATLKLFVSTIAFVHRLAGEPLDRAAFQPVLEGIRRTHTTTQRRAAAITVAELRGMVASLPDTLVGKRDRALLLVGFAGALRCSEITCLNLGRPTPPGRGFIEIDKEGARITLLRSKTDQIGRGISKWLPRGGNPCPVEALEAWLTAADIDDGPVFRGWHLPTSRRLNDKWVGVIVKQAMYASARQGGQSDASARTQALRVTSHSLRAGFVTAAALANVASSDIAAHVGWRTRHMAFHYIRELDPMTDNPAQRVLVS